MKGYDEKCYELAEYFLGDKAPKADLEQLAQGIQDAVENGNAMTAGMRICNRPGCGNGPLDDVCEVCRAKDAEAVLRALLGKWRELADSAQCYADSAIKQRRANEIIESYARTTKNLRKCANDLEATIKELG